MDLILAITLAALALLVAPLIGRLVSPMDRNAPRLTVADIQARLAAEPPRTYTPISRRW